MGMFQISNSYTIHHIYNSYLKGFKFNTHKSMIGINISNMIMINTVYWTNLGILNLHYDNQVVVFWNRIYRRQRKWLMWTIWIGKKANHISHSMTHVFYFILRSRINFIFIWLYIPNHSGMRVCIVHYNFLWSHIITYHQLNSIYKSKSNVFKLTVKRW
jgi:hypothetical protein